MPAHRDDLPVPVWLAPALDAVVADFEHPDGPPLDLTFHWLPADPSDQDVEDHGLQGTIWTDDGSGWPIYDKTDELFLYTLAGWLQDQVVLEAGLVRPVCPGHPHPAEYQLLDEKAWWQCPETGELLFRIGRRGRPE